MKKFALIFLSLLLASEAFSQAIPSGYTPNFRLRKYLQGVNPGADSLNANSTAIDAAAFDGDKGPFRFRDSSLTNVNLIKYLQYRDTVKISLTRLIVGDRIAVAQRVRSLGRSESNITTGLEVMAKGNDSVLASIRAGADGVVRGGPKFWLGSGSGAQYQLDWGAFFAHVSGESNIYDSLRFIAGKGVTLTQSGHTITTAALPSYKTSPADKPPNVANGFDDEFDAATIDTNSASPTGWGWINRHANVHATAQQGTCYVIDTGQASSNGWRILAKTVGNSAWTLTMKVSGSMSGSFTNCGLVIYNSTNGRVIFFGSNSNATTTHWIQLNKYTDLSTYSSTPYNSGAPWQMVNYLRMTKSATNVFTAYLSASGLVWSQVWTEAGGTFIEQTSGKVNKIGFGVFASANNIIAQASFWWVRVNWTPDFDPLTDN